MEPDVIVKKGEIAIGNACPVAGIIPESYNLRRERISWDEFWKFANEPHINFMGHPDSSEKLGFEMNRITIGAEMGAIIISAERRGKKRGKEGMKTLEKDDILVPFKSVILPLE